MQYYSPSGTLIGKREKSHMAEFSPNPDSRKKGEVSYATHMKRLKEQKNCSDSYRVAINKMRNLKGLLPFKDIDDFLQIIDDSGFEIGDEELLQYLLDYAINPMISTNDHDKSAENHVLIQNDSVINDLKASSSQKSVTEPQVNSVIQYMNIDLNSMFLKIVPYYQETGHDFIDTYTKIQFTIKKYVSENNVSSHDEEKLYTINRSLERAFSLKWWSEKYIYLNVDTFIEILQFYLSIKNAKQIRSRKQFHKTQDVLKRVVRSFSTLDGVGSKYNDGVVKRLNELKETYTIVH